MKFVLSWPIFSWKNSWAKKRNLYIPMVKFSWFRFLTFLKCLSWVCITYVPNISYVCNVSANTKFTISVNVFTVISVIITVVSVAITKTFTIPIATVTMIIMIYRAICFGIGTTVFFIITIGTLSIS